MSMFAALFRKQAVAVPRFSAPISSRFFSATARASEQHARSPRLFVGLRIVGRTYPQKDIVADFAPFGPNTVEQVLRRDKRPAPFVFVDFEKQADADAAFSNAALKEKFGIEYAKPKPEGVQTKA